jgi:hypothetical protein
MGRKKTFRKKRKYKHTNNNNNNNNKRTSKKNYKKTYKKRRLMKGGVTGEKSQVPDPLGFQRFGRLAKKIFGDEVLEKAGTASNTKYHNQATTLAQQIDTLTSSRDGLGKAVVGRGALMAEKLANAAGNPKNQERLYKAGVAGVNTLKATLNTFKAETLELVKMLEEELEDAKEKEILETNQVSIAETEIMKLTDNERKIAIELDEKKAIAASAKQQADALKQQQQAAAEVTINELEEKRNELNALERKTHDLLERRLQDTRAKLDAAKARKTEAIKNKAQAKQLADELNKQIIAEQQKAEEAEETEQTGETLPLPTAPPTAPPPPSRIRLPPLPPITYNPDSDADRRRTFNGALTKPVSFI